MTRKIHVHLIDDLDASEASETLQFELDGRTYEIDLSSGNAQKFRAAIAPYLQHARTVISPARRRGRAGTGTRPPRGRARAAARSTARPRGGQAADDTDGEMPAAGHPGGLPPSADLSRAVLDGRRAGPDFGGQERIPR